MSNIVKRLRACHGLISSDPECNCAEAADEIERLKAAISLHRQNVWGDGPVDHDEDVELYRALEDR